MPAAASGPSTVPMTPSCRRRAAAPIASWPTPSACRARYVQRLIEDGRLTVDGRAVKSNTLLEPGTSLELDVPDRRGRSMREPEDIPLDIVYEDDDVLIVDKPAGLVTHPSPGHARGTLVNALLGRGGSGGLRHHRAASTGRASSIASTATPAA